MKFMKIICSLLCFSFMNIESMTHTEIETGNVPNQLGHYIIQHSVVKKGFEQKGCSEKLSPYTETAFGKFYATLKWGDQPKKITISSKPGSQYLSECSPIPIIDLAELTQEEKNFHSPDSIIYSFYRPIKELKQIGKSAFIPEQIQEMEEMRSLFSKKDEVKQLAAKIITTQTTSSQGNGQSKFFQTILDLNAYFETMNSIENKTYCIAAISFNYSVKEETKDKMVVLPYVFISDGMESSVIDSMERWLSQRNVKEIKQSNFDELHQIEKEVSIISETLLKAEKSVQEATKDLQTEQKKKEKDNVELLKTLEQTEKTAKENASKIRKEKQKQQQKLAKNSQ